MRIVRMGRVNKFLYELSAVELLAWLRSEGVNDFGVALVAELLEEDWPTPWHMEDMRVALGSSGGSPSPPRNADGGER